MKTYYGLIGAGGYGREVMPLANSGLRGEILSGNAELFFVVEDVDDLMPVNGFSVISLKNFLNLPNPKRFNIAIGNSKARQRIAKICIDAGSVPFSINAKNVVTMDAIQMGHGSILSPFVTITSNVHIGVFFHANIYSYVAHDCIIGDYVTFAPSVKCNGNVVIEDHVYIGTGAAIRQGKHGEPLTIGCEAVIGMGAVVTKNVPPGITVVGNPARPLIK
ncbi:MAG: acetyltransferase [Desulfatitalea sp. BRH_c12]|nr:MAG: acetyltransferase [Desulfatitalea sp. BRH_c12]